MHALGATSPLLGATSPLLGATSPLLGATGPPPRGPGPGGEGRGWEVRIPDFACLGNGLPGPGGFMKGDRRIRENAKICEFHQKT